MVSSISGNEHLTYLRERMNQAKIAREDAKVSRDAEYSEKVQAGENKDLAVNKKNIAREIREDADTKKNEATVNANKAKEAKTTKAQEREDATKAREDAEKNVQDKTDAQSKAFTNIQTAQSELNGAQQALAAAQSAATAENPNTAAIAAAQAAVKAAQEHLKEAQEELVKATEELGIAKQELTDAKTTEEKAIAADEQADIDLEDANKAKDAADKEFEIADKNCTEAEKALAAAETIYNKENEEYETAESNYKAACEAYDDAKDAYIQAIEDITGESPDDVAEDEGYQEPKACQGGGQCPAQDSDNAQTAQAAGAAQPAEASAEGAEGEVAGGAVAAGEGEAAGVTEGTDAVGEVTSSNPKMQQMTDYYKGEAHNVIKEQFGLFSNDELPEIDDETYASISQKAKIDGYDNLTKEEQLALVTYEVDNAIAEKLEKAQNVEKYPMQDAEGRDMYTTPNGTSLVKGEDNKYYYADGSGEYDGIADVTRQFGTQKCDENGNGLFTDKDGNTVTKVVDKDGNVSYKNADGSDYEGNNEELKMQLEKYDSKAAESNLAKELNQILDDLKAGKFPAAAQTVPNPFGSVDDSQFNALIKKYLEAELQTAA